MIVDDRTANEKKTHTLGVVGTDTFMSGWGLANNGMSYAVWACTSDDVDVIEERVRNRGDMKRVRIVTLNGYKARGAKHTHIYVANK